MVETTDTTILTGGTVVTVGENRRVLDPGAIAVRDDRIIAVDERAKIQDSYDAARTISLENSIILPGLIDIHSHAGHSLTKSLAEGDSGAWYDTIEDVYFRGSNECFWRTEGFLAALERLTCGVTTSLSYLGALPRLDDPKFALAATEGYETLGLRHIVNVGPPQPPFPITCYDPETDVETDVTLEHSLDVTDEILTRVDGRSDGRLMAAVGPSRLVPEVDIGGETVSLGPGIDIELEDATATDLSVRQLRGVVELAETHDVPIHAHGHGGMVGVAADTCPRVLSSRLSLAHCAGMSESELATMAEHEVSAAHGPLTSAYVKSRFPVVEAIEQGVNVAVATDGSSPDRSFDLLSQGRIAAQLQRVHFGDPSLLPAGTVLEMMTLNAAQALGLQKSIGSLEPGKKADIIALDVSSPRLQPFFAPVHRLVNYGIGSDTRFVMVDGTVLYDEDGITSETVDVEQVYEDADRVAKEALVRTGRTASLEPHPTTWNSVRYRGSR